MLEETSQNMLSHVDSLYIFISPTVSVNNNRLIITAMNIFISVLFE